MDILINLCTKNIGTCLGDVICRAGEPEHFLAAPAPDPCFFFKRLRLRPLVFFQAAPAPAPYNFLSGSGSCVFFLTAPAP